MSDRLEPTIERRRHGQHIERASVVSDDGETGRAFRVASSLYLLRKSNRIGEAEISAAERWYRDWVTGIEGASDPTPGAIVGGGDLHTVTLARVAASSRCSAVRRALGLCGEVRLRLLMIDQLSFSAMARRLAPTEPADRSMVTGQTILVLQQLAEFYASLDADRRVGRDRA